MARVEENQGTILFVFSLHSMCEPQVPLEVPSVPVSIGLTRLFGISLQQIPTFYSTLSMPSNDWTHTSQLPLLLLWDPGAAPSPPMTLVIKALIPSIPKLSLAPYLGCLKSEVWDNLSISFSGRPFLCSLLVHKRNIKGIIYDDVVN